MKVEVPAAVGKPPIVKLVEEAFKFNPAGSVEPVASEKANVSVAFKLFVTVTIGEVYCVFTTPEANVVPESTEKFNAPTGAGFTVSVYEVVVASSVFEAFVAVTENGKVPVAVGVPLKVAVEVAKLMPAGKVPLETNVKVFEALPSVAVKITGT